jgi:glycosyltransferase involved in cell wall biosynthesis
MNWPSVSIIIPSFNQGRFIERTLLSILRQDYPGGVQVIVSDGGSTDETVDVLRRYPQVQWWSKRDDGLVDAVNKGFAEATGEILAIQSSDDFYLPDAFGLTIGELVRDRTLGIVSGCDVYVQPDRSTFACSRLDDHEITPRSLLMRRVIPQHCAFFRRDILDTVGELRPFIAEGAEIDLLYRALHFVRGRFIPFHTAAYQFHDEQRTRKGDRWYESLTMMVESCEREERFAERFTFDPADRRELYQRWMLQEARRAGDQRRVTTLTAALSTFCTEETRSFLTLHGFIPKPAARRQPRHANHRVPDLQWCTRNDRSAA